jgi:hypothetical protein
MICPYCGKEMKKGVLSGSVHSLAWKEGDKGPGAIEMIAGIGRLSAAKFKLTHLTMDSYFCKSCKKLIIDTDIH